MGVWPVQGGVLRRGWWCHRAGRALVAAVPCWRFGPVWGTCVGLASAGSCPWGNLEAGSCCSSKSQTLQATPPHPALTSSCQPKAVFSRAFAPNHPSRRAAGRDASPSCSQGGERHVKLLEKQNNPSVKVTLTDFVQTGKQIIGQFIVSTVPRGEIPIFCTSKLCIAVLK